MKTDTKNNVAIPLNSTPVGDALTDLLREGARKMLQSAIEAEVQEYCERCREFRDEQGHRVVVRNGYHPERSIQTGIGGIQVRRPKVNDKRLDEDGKRIVFTSSILPPTSGAPRVLRN